MSKALSVDLRIRVLAAVEAGASHLARAFRWRKMLETGVHATLDKLAKAKGMGTTYVGLVLRLTPLAPNTVETILDGRQPERLRPKDLLEGFPVEWAEQRIHLG
jgi:hypothetical protein